MQVELGVEESAILRCSEYVGVGDKARGDLFLHESVRFRPHRLCDTTAQTVFCQLAVITQECLKEFSSVFVADSGGREDGVEKVRGDGTRGVLK